MIIIIKYTNTYDNDIDNNNCIARKFEYYDDYDKYKTN